MDVMIKSQHIQHISGRSRQDEFQGEPAERIKIREHRRDLQNSLVSSFLKYAVHQGLFKRHAITH